MPDTCRVCGRYYHSYAEGHSPNSVTCLKNQLQDERTRLRQFEAALQQKLELVDKSLAEIKVVMREG